MECKIKKIKKKKKEEEGNETGKNIERREIT